LLQRELARELSQLSALQCSRAEGPAWHAIDQQLRIDAIVL